VKSAPHDDDDFDFSPPPPPAAPAPPTDFGDDDDAQPVKIPCSTVTGEWSALHGSGGGCYPNFATWRDNPQFALSGPKVGQAPANVTIELTCQSGESLESPTGFYIFSNYGPSLHKLAVSDKDFVMRSDFLKTSSKLELTLPPLVPLQGSSFDPCYVVVPSSFHPKIYGAFSLSLRSEAAITLMPLPTASKWQNANLSDGWRGANAGGCRNFASWASNPQYVLNVNGYTPEPTNPVVIVLAQHPKDPSKHSDLVAIGFYVLTSAGNIVGKAAFMVAPEVQFQLPYDRNENCYIIVPCTFEPGIERTFDLVAYSQLEVELNPGQ
jgi:hypothetical protein